MLGASWAAVQVIRPLWRTIRRALVRIRLHHSATVIEGCRRGITNDGKVMALGRGNADTIAQLAENHAEIARQQMKRRALHVALDTLK